MLSPNAIQSSNNFDRVWANYRTFKFSIFRVSDSLYETTQNRYFRNTLSKQWPVPTLRMGTHYALKMVALQLETRQILCLPWKFLSNSCSDGLRITDLTQSFPREKVNLKYFVGIEALNKTTMTCSFLFPFSSCSYPLNLIYSRIITL